MNSQLKPMATKSNSLGMTTYRPRICTPNWDKVLNIHCLTKEDAIHHANQEIDLIMSIISNPDTQF